MGVQVYTDGWHKFGQCRFYSKIRWLFIVNDELKAKFRVKGVNFLVDGDEFLYRERRCTVRKSYIGLTHTNLWEIVDDCGKVLCNTILHADKPITLQLLTLNSFYGIDSFKRLK